MRTFYKVVHDGEEVCIWELFDYGDKKYEEEYSSALRYITEAERIQLSPKEFDSRVEAIKYLWVRYRVHKEDLPPELVVDIETFLMNPENRVGVYQNILE